ALQVSAGRLWASATIDAALPAGTNAIGKLAANSGVTIGAVELASSQTLAALTSITNTVTTKEARAATATITSVNDTNTSTTILASNANRLGATVYNDSTATLYLLLGSGTASSTTFTVK